MSIEKTSSGLEHDALGNPIFRVSEETGAKDAYEIIQHDDELVEAGEIQGKTMVNSPEVLIMKANLPGLPEAELRQLWTNADTVVNIYGNKIRRGETAPSGKDWAVLKKGYENARKLIELRIQTLSEKKD